MIVQTIAEAMSRTPYPGRGILAGKSADGGQAILCYFIMGRSTNSRNRVFVADGDGLRTRAFDPAKVVDPSLIIYAPVRIYDRHTIVTNGDHTDTIYQHLRAGGSFESALNTHRFEPDAPNFTPRIGALMTVMNGDCQLRMSIIKSAGPERSHVARYFFIYDSPPPGRGYFLHTYARDGHPLPPFEGEPEHVQLDGDLYGIAREVWANLDPYNKVSLWARATNLNSGAHETVIINRHGEGAS